MAVEEGFYVITPYSIAKAGSSGSGKTELVYKLLLHADEVFKPKPKNLIVLYSQYQDIYDKVKSLKNFEKILFHEGVDYDFTNISDTLIVVDDQMKEIMQSPKVQDVFTKLSHHKSITIITLVQNLFPTGRFSRDIRLNLHYYIIMKSFALQSQVKHLGLQLFPQYPKYLQDAYKKGTVEKFSYLVVVLHPRWTDVLRVVTGIFDPHPVVFLPK